MNSAPAPLLVGVGLGVRMDQVELEPAEEHRASKEGAVQEVSREASWGQARASPALT